MSKKEAPKYKCKCGEELRVFEGYDLLRLGAKYMYVIASSPNDITRFAPDHDRAELPRKEGDTPEWIRGKCQPQEAI